jgi:diguanylate cyclase (GGDEF)-like protein/PAS domain S-box-containing protein
VTDTSGSGTSRVIGLPTLAAALEFIDEVVVAATDDGTITFVSPSMRTVLGWDPLAVMGRNVVEYLRPEDIEEMLNNLSRWSGRDGQMEANPLRVLSSEGEYVELQYSVVAGPTINELGDFVVTMRPTANADAERNRLLHSLTNEGRLVRLARTFLGLHIDNFDKGLHEATLEVAGLKWVTRVSVWQTVGDQLIQRSLWQGDDGAPTMPLDEQIPLSRLGPLPSMEELHLRSPEEIVDGPFAAAGRAMVHSGVIGLLAVPMKAADRFVGLVMIEHTYPEGSFDTTHFSALRAAAAILAEAFARNDAERELAARASTDILTGLANRWSFQRELDGLLERAVSEPDFGVGVALFDLDRFKMVNDSLGHEAGDHLLVEVTKRLTTAISGAHSSDVMLARLGGDEFLLLVAGNAGYAEAVRLTSDVLSSLGPPFEIEGDLVQLTASTGLAYVQGEIASSKELLRRADLAMFRVKHQGGGRLGLADRSKGPVVSDRLREEALLRSAISDGQLRVYLQGEWDLSRQVLTGAEALVRWQHPVLGLRTAGEFVGLAEESDLIIDIDEWVVAEAARWLAQQRSRGYAEPFTLRANLSARHLRQPALAERIEAILAAACLSANDLCLELTESSLLVDPRSGAKTLEDLRALGCGVGVDDLGTGYSSLLYLKNLPLSCIKIDRVFVAGLPDGVADRAIVSCVVELGSSLGVTVVAEGVETEAQRQALIEIGCERAQGHFLSAPESMDDFARRLDLAPS